MRFVNKLNLGSVLLVSLSASPANAARYCHSPAELESRVKTCWENAYYAEAAVLCVESFKKKVDKVAGKTGQALGQAVAKMKSAQDKNFDTTGANYETSESALQELIKEGEARLAESDAYLDQVVFPEDAGQGGGDASAELKNTRCYQRNVDAISLVKKDFSRKLAELRSAKAAAAGLRGVSDGREAKIGGETTLGDQTGSGIRQRGPVTTRDGVDRRGESGISGREKKKSK